MNESSESFFIEFVGIPGSGKSTLAHELANVLRAEGFNVFEPTYKISEEVPRKLRRFYKLPYVLHGLYGNFSHLINQFFRKGYATTDLKILMNWFYIYGVKKKYSAKKGITLYDQGVIQALWSFILSESEGVIKAYERNLFKNTLSHSGLIICVEADFQTVEKRLQGRVVNNSRVGITEQAKYSLDDAVKSYNDVTQIIRSLVSKKKGLVSIIVKNNSTEDLLKNVELIREQLSKMYLNKMI